MTTPTQKFASDPFKFCDDNLVIIRHGGPPGEFNFTLVEATTAQAKTWAGRAVPVYDLVQKDAGDTFLAYWLPYNNNDKYQIKLRDDGARVMLTPTMDGCTFAVGGRNAKNKVKVAHLNYQSQVDDTNFKPVQSQATASQTGNVARATKFVVDQPKIDNELNAIFEDGATYVLRKGDYKSKEGHQVTTYGVRTAKGWAFYYQKRRLTGNKMVGFMANVDFEGTVYPVKQTRSVEKFEFIGNYTGIKHV